MPSKPIFYDPEQVRRKRTRQVTLLALILTVVLILLFGLSILEAPLLPSLNLRPAPRGFRPVETRASRHKASRHRRRTFGQTRPGTTRTQPIRAAFYVNWDPTSFTSLRAHYRELDLLIPEWLHMTSLDGRMRMEADAPLLDWLRREGIDIQIMPLLNNFDAATGTWRSRELAAFLSDPAAERRLLANLEAYVRIRRFAGVVLDFEEVPESSQHAFRQFVVELTARMRGLGGKVLVSLPAADASYDYQFFGQATDGIILMDYDEHWPGSAPGPVASQRWFVKNLGQISRLVPREKVLVGIGSHGYDWIVARKAPPARSGTFEEALVTAQESEATITLDPDALNPQFEYYDEQGRRHVVWFLDAISSYNEIVESDRAGMAGVALWRLGSEDPTLWAIFDQDSATAANRELLKRTSDWYDLVRDGAGEILHLASTPRTGRRSFHYDGSSGLITEATYDELPTPYIVQMVGDVPGKIVLSFDDGPDPEYTPKILDILKAKHAPAIFFVTGLQANKFMGLMRRIYAEGHEVGNHTFTHPDISQLPPAELRLELNLSQRLFECELGVKTIFFRPPYNVDSDPDTPGEVRPLETVQKLGYVIVGNKIDPKDYLLRDPTAIIANTFAQLASGHVVLLHDGGGDRRATVAALPELIDRLRAEGKEIVPLGALLGKTRDQVMPRLDRRDRWIARGDFFIFHLIGLTNLAIAWVFVAAIGLVSGRLIVIGILAVYQKLRRRLPAPPAEFRPRVAVLIPAYNEERVIVRTVRSVLASDWPELEVVVVDDGSQDATYAELERAFGTDRRVRILRQPNQGKPAALSYGLSTITAEILVGVDADTYIEPDAIRLLVRHFVDPKVAAVAGNAKVGNRHNLLTRWQALEYITSQNLDRRAFDVLNCITVVPGAIGAWRTAVVRECGGFPSDTVAEDTDLTLSILRRGYRIRYDDEAVAWTEAPDRWGTLVRQRFRWTFGTLQAVWKHRDTLARRRYGTLGWVALPNVFIFQLFLPMFSPVVDLMMAWSFFWWGFAKALQHWPVFVLPQVFAVSTEHLIDVLMFFLVFTLVDLLACELAFLLEKGESHRLLFWLVPQRFAYRQMMYYVLFRTLVRALEGSTVGWGRVERPVPRSIRVGQDSAPG